MATDDTDLMSTRTVGNYFGRSSRTVERWQVDPELNFAQPMVIRGRKYWPRGEVGLSSGRGRQPFRSII
jgi:hypothetical protein